ncbi:NmrA family NAD(P)-binding protein [Streptomyces sp. NPDC048172]|uniref:NmrA family NAD(P)-binding protein n=1 Tax=Streptomyces sp. NPDC048172 TaxID=3365505 RepID=UPI00371E57BB
MPDRTGTILVTGATGTTGSRVVAALEASGRPVRSASRTAPVPFDWYDPATHDAALAGAEAVYLVPPVGATDPGTVMLPFLTRARSAGVRRAVLLSSSPIEPGGPATGPVHAALPGEFEEWAVLRPSWFMQNFTGNHLQAESARTHGEIVSATDGARVGFIDADDIAAVAAHALTTPEPPNTDWILTGPEALSYDDIARTLTEVTGRTVRHHALTAEELQARWVRELPADFAQILADVDRAIAAGAEDRVTDAVARLTGRAPRSFADHVRAAADTRSAPA